MFTSPLRRLFRSLATRPFPRVTSQSDSIRLGRTVTKRYVVALQQDWARTFLFTDLESPWPPPPTSFHPPPHPAFVLTHERTLRDAMNPKLNPHTPYLYTYNVPRTSETATHTQPAAASTYSNISLSRDTRLRCDQKRLCIFFSFLVLFFLVSCCDWSVAPSPSSPPPPTPPPHFFTHTVYDNPTSLSHLSPGRRDLSFCHSLIPTL